MNSPEARIDSFLSQPEFEKQELFKGGRFPNLAVATDGTVLATWGSEAFKLRRSEDGGKNWQPEIEITRPGFHGGGVTVDESSGDIIIFAEAEHPPKTPQPTIGPLKVFRSHDQGRSWRQVEITIEPDQNGNIPSRHMTEHGITLRHGPWAGRLLRPARVYDKGGDHPKCYSCAIYSDNGGQHWKASTPFPIDGTGESATVELANGDIYHNSRKHYYHTNPANYENCRHLAWSYDGGASWRNPDRCPTLPDGPAYRGAEKRGSNYNGHFGMLAGLTRLPVANRDILIYSNADTPCHQRIGGTVWASFDGGQTWPVKRLVQSGPFAYSSLNAGWPGTASEGRIYLQFEGGDHNCYENGLIARFNLSWLLAGESTGDGRVPEWVKPDRK